MKRHIPIAAAIASAVALTVPALAGATTYCVAKPECVAAGGTDAPSLGAAFSAAGTLSPGQDRIEIGPGDFTATAGGFSYPTPAHGEGVDIVGSGIGVTRLLNSSTNNVERTLQLNGLPESSVSDLSIVAPTPAGAQPIVWAYIGSATLRRVDISGAHDFIAAQLNQGSRLEDSSVHGDANHTAISSSDHATISHSSVQSTGQSILISSGALDISRSTIDAHAGPSVSGNATLTISDSLVTTHGGPGLRTGTGVNTVLHATGDTLVGDGNGSAGVLAGEGAASHSTHVTVSNTVISGYGHAVIANQDGGAVDVKLSHSDFDDTTVSASPGQVDTSDANTGAAPGFAAGFHLDPSSPLVDAGDPATASQADLDGSQRSLDGNGDGTAAPDIGAFEVPAVAPPQPPTTPTTPAPTPETPGGDVQPPVTPKDAAPSLTAFKAAKRRVVRGHRTSFRFKVSEASRVRITLRRRGHAVRTLKRRAHAGRNKVAWRASLKPGRFVAIAQATDSAGQHSVKRRVRFRLRAPLPR